jgi:adenosylhomocysteine nucleosidase
MNTGAVHIGLISALQQEQAGLVDLMHNVASHRHGMRDYISGTLGYVDCVCVLSRIGKVAAAATVATLIERFQVTHILFTGVAGAGSPDIAIGDIVVAETLVQHDMDATPLFPRYEVPLLGISHFATDRGLTEGLMQDARGFIEQDFTRLIGAEEQAAFRLRPRLHHGLVASGDEFISDRARLAQLRTTLPDLLAVEMEGAAVAQVCFEFGIPFAVIRTISDAANEDSPVDFMRFIERVAAPYAIGIVQRMCARQSLI